MKRVKMILYPFLTILLYCPLHAQVVKSEKSSLRINVPETNTKATNSYQFKVISPQLEENRSMVSDTGKINIIGRVSDPSGIVSLIINGEIEPVSENGLYTYNLTLKPGENRLTITTINGKEISKEHIFRINYVPKVVTFADKVARESRYFGLIIGINNYRDPVITPLDNPIRDATSLYNTLITNYTFDSSNIIFLKDPEREAIINALDDLSGKITPNDNLLIFYAGHGWWDKDANIGYWIPSNASSTNKANWFRNSTLVDYLKEINTHHTLLIADACFGGAIFKTRKAFGDASKAIEKLYELPSRKAMTSGTLTEVPDRSAFTRFLIDRLINNKEKYLSSEQLFSSFRIAVINNSDVIPQYGEIRNVGDQGGDFIFIKKDEP
ncbi:MAG: caspase family protein [Chlorobi bacterium]|nr:caspase family protein [Chlorobiota bacterium]